MIWLNPIMALATPEEPWVLVVDHHSVMTYKRKPRLKDYGSCLVRESDNRGTYRYEAEFSRSQFEAAQQTELSYGSRYLLIKGET